MFHQETGQFVLKVGEVHRFTAAQDVERPERWIQQGIPLEAWRCCFQNYDGTIFLSGRNKSTDGGRTVVTHNMAGVDKISILHNMLHPTAPGPEGAVFSRPGFFLALDGWSHFKLPGVYSLKVWRSADNLRTVEEGEALLKVPPGPRREREDGEWFGLFMTRSILEMPDGSLLATGHGNFDEDKIVPHTGAGKSETHYQGRVFLLSSKDDGETWEYLSTVAAPREGDPVDEGFGEPTLARLANGQLLCIMRTGHHRPLHACWSSDEARTWSEPVYTGLDRGCFPCLVKLGDGRLALTFGVRFPPGWSCISPEGDHARWRHPGKGLVKLAINEDGTGQTWTETVIGTEMGTCYSTMFETEPNILFCQVDGWYWRVMLVPKVPDTL